MKNIGIKNAIYQVARQLQDWTINEERRIKKKNSCVGRKGDKKEKPKEKNKLKKQRLKSNSPQSPLYNSTELHFLRM